MSSPLLILGIFSIVVPTVVTFSSLLLNSGNVGGEGTNADFDEFLTMLFCCSWSVIFLGFHTFRYPVAEI
jgi:hypothetical protein